RSAYLCGYDCLAHDAHLVDTNLEDRGHVAAVGVCFGASSADPGIGNVTHQERRAQRSSEWLDSDSGIAVYCGSTRRGCFFKHCAGTQSAVRHPPGGAGDNGRVITTTKYLVCYAREFSPCGAAVTPGRGDDVLRAKEKRYQKAT